MRCSGRARAQVEQIKSSKNSQWRTWRSLDSVRLRWLERCFVARAGLARRGCQWRRDARQCVVHARRCHREIDIECDRVIDLDMCRRVSIARRQCAHSAIRVAGRAAIQRFKTLPTAAERGAKTLKYSLHDGT